MTKTITQMLEMDVLPHVTYFPESHLRTIIYSVKCGSSFYARAKL